MSVIASKIDKKQMAMLCKTLCGTDHQVDEVDDVRRPALL
jgi:hypothetical protein